MQRVVLHIDLDSFYAQVEELRHPEIAGKPVVIGMYSGRTETSGAVATANYAARKLGIRSGLSLGLAQQRATPETVFLKADRPYYLEVSHRVMEVFRRFGDRFEQKSIDEAALEVTERCNGSFAKAEALAKELKVALKKEERLTCSVGVGPNKLIAKIAAGMHKPDGMTVVTAGRVDAFLEPLEVGELYGLGPKSSALLEERNVKTVKQLKLVGKAELVRLFGDARGHWFYNAARGIDDGAVQEEPQKQLSRIGTLKKDAASAAEAWPEVEKLATAVADRVERFHLQFKTIGIVIVTAEMGSATRSVTLKQATGERAVLVAEAKKLLETFFKENPKTKLRRAGVSVSHFETKGAGLKKWLG